ncbi:LAGLIDADG family homing endonuclease [Arthrobacter methylotrophus]|uniref:LAGLIDADG family homing endonuclease n=1 Tax=Arthrobacter methylotrophus TaxID=121291 RepID=A0ABV5UR68_9MICC
MAAPRRNQAPGKPITGLVMVGAAAAAGYLIYQGYPGIAAIWAGLLVSAWTYPPAMFTGKKDARGYPSPASPGEQAAMNKYRLWEDLKFKLVLPNLDWLPGLKPRLSFLAAVWAGAAAYLIPVTDIKYTAGYGPWIDAAAAFIAVAQYAASRRRTQVADDENPGARVDSLIALVKKNRPKVIGLTIGGIVVGGVVGTIATVLLPIATTAAKVPAIPEPAIWALVLTGGPLALLSKAWIAEALEHWRVVVAAREEWKGRWEMLKQDPAPRLIDRQEVGSAIIDTFDAPSGTGAAPYFVMAEKINPTLGTGAKFAVLDVPNLDSNNSPVPGTKHPLRFEIVRWPSDQMPDITDPETPKEVVYQLARCAIAWAADGVYSRPVIDEVHLLTAPPAPAEEPEDGEEAQPAPAAGGAAWAITWYLPDGPPASYIRANGRNEMAEVLNALVLVDHRAQNGVGCAYAGALLDANTNWDPSCGLTTKDMKKLADEDAWNNRWAEAAPKHKANPPIMEASTAATARLKNGVTVHNLAFITRQGMTPHDFFVFEDKLNSTLNAAPFVSMTGFQGTGKRPGERHPQAFCVRWSSEAVPAKPDDLAPVPRSDAPKWVLAGLVNQAFKAARLADRPEIAAVTCLTKPESRQHIWKIELRLYGGVTLAQVRTAAQTIRQHWASEWLRVAAAQDGCTIVVGARPSKVQLASPRHEQYLASLDWEQAFLDSGVSGTGGLLPTLTSVGSLPNNEKVTVTDFNLPAGLDYTMVRAVTEKLKSATDNIFIDVQRTASASSIRILSCPENPMPDRVSFDFDAVDNSGHYIPFATGIEGEPIMFDPITSPHALLAGVTRSGKSVLAQGFVYGMLVKGALVFIIDPMKAAADFKFAKDYAAGFAVDLYEAAATLKAVYAIVVERRKINSAMGVGSYHELADPPPPLVVLIDEFTSLMQKEIVPPASDDPEEEVLREEIIAINRAKQEIGTFTGKLAREAASAGVNLLLGTQKLSAKMLDTLPGGGDLKDLTLDTRLPVPVSEKFPTGWARNDELELGDDVYTPNGTTTPIIKFSDVFTDNKVYAVTFDDGQVIKAGAGHLWQASDCRSRKNNSRTDYPRGVRAEDVMWMRKAVESMPSDLYVTAADLARLTGYETTARIHHLATEFGLGRFTRHSSTGTLMTYDRDLRRGGAGRLYSLDSAIEVLATHRGSSSLTKFAGQWLSSRDIAEAMDGRTVNRMRAGNIGTALRVGECPWKPIEHPAFLYNARDFMAALGEHRTDILGRDPRTGDIQELERIVTTEEMAASVTDSRGGLNWAIRVADPIDGPDADLPVDPYVLGAWLGDGCKGSGNVVSSAATSCTDKNGLSDQQHMLEQLEAAGYEPRVLACSDILIGTRGLKVKLREAGVLHDKHIPAMYLRASKSQRLALLQGLMDTDGSLMASGQCTLPQNSRRMAEGILELTRSLGIKARWTEWASGYVPEGSTEKNMTGTTHNVSFRTALPVFRLPRKQAKQAAPIADGSTTRRLIVSIEQIETEPTRCIGVADEGHLFLAEGFIPTHNTNLARTLLGQASSGDRMSALRDFDAAPSVGNPIPKGRGLWEPLDHSAVVIQTWFATQDQMTAALAERIPVIADESKPDISQYLRRPQAEEASSAATPAPATRQMTPAAVVDLGEIELDLDDLDWSDMDLDSDEGATDVPVVATAPEETATEVSGADLDWPDDEAESEVDTEAAMLLDVDGAMAPFTFRDGLDHIAAPGHGTIMFDPTILKRMAAVPVTQAWLTSWEDDAPDNFGHLFPRATEVLVADTENTGWWKIDAALDWIKENPQIRRLVWIDDELASEDLILGLTYRDIAEDAFEAAGVDALLVVPNADQGVTDAELDEVEAFFGAATAEVSAPATPAAPAEEPVEELEPEPVIAAVPEALDWAAMEADVAAPAQAPQTDIEDPFAVPALAAEAPDLHEDPFAEPVPRKRFVPDDDDPFA